MHDTYDVTGRYVYEWIYMFYIKLVMCDTDDVTDQHVYV